MSRGRFVWSAGLAVFCVAAAQAAAQQACSDSALVGAVIVNVAFNQRTSAAPPRPTNVPVVLLTRTGAKKLGNALWNDENQTFRIDLRDNQSRLSQLSIALGAEWQDPPPEELRQDLLRLHLGGYAVSGFSADEPMMQTETTPEGKRCVGVFEVGAEPTMPLKITVKGARPGVAVKLLSGERFDLGVTKEVDFLPGSLADSALTMTFDAAEGWEYFIDRADIQDSGELDHDRKRIMNVICKQTDKLCACANFFSRLFSRDCVTQARALETDRVIYSAK